MTAKLIDNIRDCGEVKCTFELETSRPRLTELITISYNVYSQIITVTQLETKSNSYSVQKFQNVSQKRNELKVLSVIQYKHENEIRLLKQRINGKLEMEEEFKYNFDVISTFYFEQKLILQNNKKISKHYVISTIDFHPHKTSNNTQTKKFSQLNIPINISHHEIRRYVLYKSVLMYYKLHIPNDILSTIFDAYYTNIFDIYGDPFVCDSLQLDINKLNQYKKGLKWYRPLKKVRLLCNKYCNKIQECNVNGLGINIAITEIPPDITGVQQILNKYDLDIFDKVEAIWPATEQSINKLERLKTELPSEIKCINLNVSWLLDSDINKNNKFMLWVDEYGEDHSFAFGSSFNYSFDYSFDTDFNNYSSPPIIIPTRFNWINSFPNTYIPIKDITTSEYQITNYNVKEQTLLRKYITHRKLQQRFARNNKFHSKANAYNRAKYGRKCRKHTYHRW